MRLPGKEIDGKAYVTACHRDQRICFHIRTEGHGRAFLADEHGSEIELTVEEFFTLCEEPYCYLVRLGDEGVVYIEGDNGRVQGTREEYEALLGFGKEAFRQSREAGDVATSAQLQIA